jgi:RNA polymerase sigma factor (sigma-70 family)
MTRPTDEIDSRIDIERILAALPPQQRRAVSLYARGYTQAEIARKMGVSCAAICQLFQRIVNKYG